MSWRDGVVVCCFERFSKRTVGLQRFAIYRNVSHSLCAASQYVCFMLVYALGGGGVEFMYTFGAEGCAVYTGGMRCDVCDVCAVVALADSIAAPSDDDDDQLFSVKRSFGHNHMACGQSCLFAVVFR